MRLLFINAFKGLKKKKVQMLGIVLMVVLSTGIYTAMSTSLDRLENRYYNYLVEQNVEDFSFIPTINYQKDISLADFDQMLTKEFKDVTDQEKLVLMSYQNCLKTKCTLDEMMLYQISSIFDKYHASDGIAASKLASLTEKYNFTYEQEPSKVMNEEKYILKAIPYDKDKKINVPYLVKGTMPTKDNEITVLPKFASNNNLNIGDIYKINGKEYKIVGFAYASDHVYPMISFNIPFFDEKYNNIMFMNETTYEEFDGISDNVYAGKFNYKTDREDKLHITVGFGSKEENDGKATDDVVSKMYEDEADIMGVNMSVISRVMRTDMLSLELSTDRTFANAFLYLLLGISVFIIVIITKKRIDDERLQIGVLKSLGYNSFQIACGYLVYPIVGSIIGGVLGYLIGICFNPSITSLFLSYFTVPLSGFQFNMGYLIICILTPLIVLSILSYFISVFMLRKKPLYLLKEGSNLKVNIFSRFVTKITKPLPFDYRFKYSLAFRSLGKLVIVSLTSFCTGLLIVLILIGMNLFNSMIDKTFGNFKYDYMVNYNTPITLEDDTSDLSLNMTFKLTKILNRSNQEKKLNEDDYSLSVSGVDPKLRYIEIKDKQERNLLPKLTGDDNIVINENVKEVMNVDVGDTLVLTYNEKEYQFHVVGVSDSFMGSTGYVDREILSELLGFPLSYNVKYTTDIKYSTMSKLDSQELNQINSIFSLDDLERNIRKQMQTANSSIYIVILFASFMALIIIGVIANIVVEENKKTISLMKVMGYKDKNISKVVLNIYTPAVIISYLVSIPVMIWILKKIVKTLVGDMNMAIPITLSPWMAIVGLIGLVVAYYIAINLSRRVLNKVPLAVALKRE